MDAKGKKVDKCQSEKQLFELFGSWGYKQYMNVQDLINAKEKYLTSDFNTLMLNCKIVLFYTITSKSFTNDSIGTDTSILLTGGNQESILIDVPIKLASTHSIGTVFNSSSCFNEAKTRKSGKNYPRKNLMKINSLKECNTLLYDMRRMLASSNMFDLIVQAPVRLLSDFLDLNTSIKKDNVKQFKVHSLVLALRSEVFEKMFYGYGEKSRNTTSLVNIVDFDAFTVEVFLKYLYTDMIEISLKNIKQKLKYLQQPTTATEECFVRPDGKKKLSKETNLEHEKGSSGEDEEADQVSSDETEERENRQITQELYTHLFIELFKISDKYCVYRLKQLSEMQLTKLITCENMVELLILAYMHNAVKLKTKCYDYLVENFSSIIKQKNWSFLESHYPALLSETFRILHYRQ